MHKLLEKIEKLAVEAGKATLEVYESDDFDVQHKGDDSPLTRADLAAHKIIMAGLTELTPDIPVLSEESADIDYSVRSTWDKYWLVDPLDGTKEFIKRNGEFTINIALIDAGKAILSAVYVPVTDVGYSAAEGIGAFKTEQGGKKAIQVKRPASEVPVVVGSRSHLSPDVQTYLNKLGEHSLVSMGSSLKFCLVAEGAADLYPRLGLTSEWDTAAAQCIVEQAGGAVVGMDGQPLLYNTKDSLLNPYFMVYGDNSKDWLNPS
ncbi:3'(2'),5'-bisphosphate nucleotidase CysQ [Marinicella sp. W31]|uniref:3'(2'),5'-bisphosphate nucleotidase CysQ n=1 Tax=Marinicella sp. W31 TaxID=3023713 RepID=UPI0037579F8B